MHGEAAPDRKVFRISGADQIEFLQGLVSNDVKRLDNGLVYAALLTPQGKYLADFFLVPGDEAVLLDIKQDIAAATMQRLAMYKLRAKVAIEPTDLKVTCGLGTPPEGTYTDPRHPTLGWRAYGTDTGTPPTIDWDALRVAACIPETGVELIPNQTFILEAGFERLHGVDFRKGCYVGQEVTARMKHKIELRKGFATVSVDGTAPIGTPITANEKAAGTLYTQSGGRGIAYLRFDRAEGGMWAETAQVSLK